MVLFDIDQAQVNFNNWVSENCGRREPKNVFYIQEWFIDCIKSVKNIRVTFYKEKLFSILLRIYK